MKSPDLSILIVNYNTKDVTLDCLKAIYASQTTYTYEVIVVDNASTDGSIEALQKFKLPLTLIKNPENSGFAKANNIAARSASGKYLWLLNSDTLIEPNTIQQLLDQAISHHSYLATCRLLNLDGSLQPQGGALPNLVNLTTWMLNLDSFPFIAKLIPPYQEFRRPNFELPAFNFQPGWIGGTAMLVRRDLYLSLNGLDENIFMYGEDVEFCYRVKQGFLQPDYFYQPSLIHLGQKSSSSQRALLGEFSGLKYIFKKHKPTWQQLYLRVILKVGTLLRVISFAVTGDVKRRNIYAKAFKMA